MSRIHIFCLCYLLFISASPTFTAAPPTTFLGAFDFLMLETSPVEYHGKIMLMETVPVKNSEHQPPCTSCYFSVRDLQTWKVMATINQSCNHAFGSAMVSKDAQGVETFWVYGTRWYRENANILRTSDMQPAWTGPCNDGNCAVDVFWSSDPQLKVWQTATAAMLPKGTSAYNVDVAEVDPAALAKFNPGLPTHRWIMAVEVIVPGNGGFFTTFMINNGITPLVGNWSYLQPTKYILPMLGHGSNGIGACPSIRYVPATGYYYVITGGDKVYILRSKDLVTWETGHYNGGAVFQSSPTTDCKAMPGNWTAWHPDANTVTQLNRCSAWDKFASDADLTEFVQPNGKVSTMLMYQVSDQATQGLSLFSQYDGDQASYFAANFQ